MAGWAQQDRRNRPLRDLADPRDARGLSGDAADQSIAMIMPSREWLQRASRFRKTLPICRRLAISRGPPTVRPRGHSCVADSRFACLRDRGTIRAQAGTKFTVAGGHPGTQGLHVGLARLEDRCPSCSGRQGGGCLGSAGLGRRLRWRRHWPWGIALGDGASSNGSDNGGCGG